MAQSTTPMTKTGAFPLVTAQSIVQSTKDSPLVVWDVEAVDRLEANYPADNPLDLSNGGTQEVLILSASILPQVAQPSLTLYSSTGASQWLWYPGATQLGGNFVFSFDELIPITGTGADVGAVEKVVFESETPLMNKAGDVIIKASSSLTANMTDTLVVADGDYATGDVVHFQLTITNISAGDLFGVAFTDTPTAGYSLVAGTVTSTQGTVVLGNTPGDTSISVNVGFIGTPPCHVGFVNIGFDLQIDMDDSLLQVCNQGTVTATGGINTVTNDASTVAADDANCSPFPITDTVPPVLTIMGNNPEFVDCNGVYTDAGALAIDGRDGNRTSQIQVSGLPIDTSVLGNHFVTYYVEDTSGNSSQEIRTVTVQDMTPPTAICKDINLELDGSGTATIVPADVDNGSGDTCGGVTLSLSQDTFTCSDVGITVVTLTVTDDAANISTCQANVTVQDPLGVCLQNLCATPNLPIPDNNPAGVSSTQTIASGGIITDLNLQVSGTHTYVGDLIFTLTHVDTAKSVVFINRPINGTGTCASNNFDLVLDDEGANGTANTVCNGDANPWIISGGSYIPANPLSLFDGDNIQGDWTLSIADNAGADVGTLLSWCLLPTVDLPPVALCQDITIQLDAAGNASIIASQVDGGSTDGVGVQSVSVTPNTFTCADVGAKNVVLSVTDTVGQISQCNATVTVEDVTSPTITRSGNAAVTVECGTNYSDAGATATDVCSGVLTGSIVTVNPVDTGTPGIYTVTYNVQDASGNDAAQVTRTVTVEDTTAPTITLGGNASETISCGVAYIDAGATASDDCDGGITPNIVVNNPVNVNIPGMYTVTYDVTDSSGNPASQVSRSVTVQNDCPVDPFHSADQNANNVINLQELLRVIQFFNIGTFHCDALETDGFSPGSGDQSCTPHDSDYNPQNWTISLTELLRLIQFFNLGGYSHCPGVGEDDFCPGL